MQWTIAVFSMVSALVIFLLGLLLSMITGARSEMGKTEIAIKAEIQRLEAKFENRVSEIWEELKLKMEKIDCERDMDKAEEICVRKESELKQLIAEVRALKNEHKNK